MSLSISDSMDQILGRFDEAWNDPTPPRIEDYLAKANPDNRLALLIELVRIDLERRLATGEKLRLEEAYLPRFPELAAETPVIVTLAKHEYAVRRRNEPELMPTEYLGRFPQCQTELLAQLPTLDEIRDREPQPTTAETPAGLDLRGYELSETLGRGGMGEVYRCVDPALGRDLAIKVMRAEYCRHPEAAGRFLREARVTGSLQHPGIVPIHNLGRMSDGRLHYTMRLVRGQTFARILQEEAGKPERLPYLLSIFEKICQAVAYAHSKRVIHRDLKPQNVMVGKFGEVQVMDWGLAKVLMPGERGCVSAPREEDTIGTRIVTEADTPSDLSRMGSGMGTPAYMPQEQALGEWDAVDERADVFALGSILCEMLTGQPAYSGTDGNEVYRRAKRGDMTEALQRLQQCGADAALTALCRECLSPNREDRPRDAAAVAKRVAEYQAEVQERLRRVEVERAQAQLKMREGRKQRRLLIALVLALLVGAALSTWQAMRATAERDYKDKALVEAEAAAEREHQAQLREAERAEGEKAAKLEAEENLKQAKENLAFAKKGNDILGSVFTGLDPKKNFATVGQFSQSLRDNLKKAVQELEGSAIGDPLTVAHMQNTLGLSLVGLGEPSQAIILLEKARDTMAAKLGPDHPETLTCMNNLAGSYQHAGQLKQALPLWEETLKLVEAKLGHDHPDTLRSMNNLAAGYYAAGKWDLALPLLEETLKINRVRLGPNHPDTLTCMNNLAEGYRAAAMLDRALPLLEETLKLRRAKLGPDHPDTLISMDNLALGYKGAGKLNLALPLWEETFKLTRARLGPNHPDTLTCMNNLALGYRTVGKLDRALSLWEETLKTTRVKLGPDHPDTLRSMNNLANGYRSAGKLEQAMPLLKETLKLTRAKLGVDHPHTLLSMNNLALGYWSTRQLEKSVPLFEETLKLQEKKLGRQHPDTQMTVANLGVNYKDAGRVQEALPLLEEAFQTAKTNPTFRWVGPRLLDGYVKVGKTSEATKVVKEMLADARKHLPKDSPQLAGMLAQFGLSLLQAHAFADAESLLRECLSIRDKRQPDAWNTFNTQSTLGGALLGQKKYADAEPLLLQGYERMKARESKIPPNGQLRLTEALERIVQLYEATDQKDKAAEWRKKLQETKAAQKKPKS